MNPEKNGDHPKIQMYSQEKSFLVNDLSNIIATHVRNESDIEILSTNNEELMFSLQDLEGDAQLYYDIEKEENITVDDYVKMKFLEHPSPKGKLTTFRDENMKKINNQVYKKLENPGYGPIIDLTSFKVVYEYAFFIENREDPIDASRFKRDLGTIHISKDIFTLAGIHDSVETMKYKEQSLFWISHELMYGQLGVRPRIPPKADFLVRIKIIKIFDNDLNEIKLRISKFEENLQSAGKAYSLARIHFNKGDFSVAIAIYKKWINTLENTALADEVQEKEIKQFLIKMYMNIALCYNRVDNPQRTCLAIRELEKLTSIADNPKALFAKGKAKMMLHDDVEAKKLFKAALKIEPKNAKILKTLNELESRKSAKKDYVSSMNELKIRNENEIAEFKDKQQHINKFLKSLQ